MSRKAIYIDNLSHNAPIPAACRVGPLVESSVVHGVPLDNAEAGLEEQCRNMLENVRRIMNAADGTLDDVAKLTIFLNDKNQRDTLNKVWEEFFFNVDRRPARQVVQSNLAGGRRVECIFTAYTAAVMNRESVNS